MEKSKQTGLTLLELMVTLVVAAIILGVGVPSFVEFIRNGRMAANTNDLITGIHLARSEAVKRRVPVTVCSSNDPTAAAPACAAGTLNGWIVFVDDNDTNGDGTADGNGIVEAGEVVLSAHEGLPNNMTINADGSYISFATSGFTRNIAGLGAGVTQVLLCDERGNKDVGGGNSAARVLLITQTGRAQIRRDTGQVAATLGGCP